MTLRRERLGAALILAVYLVYAVSFSLGPIMEGPDEREHYQYIHVLAHTRRFPDAATTKTEFYQAPLYYLAMAPVVLAVRDTDFETTSARLNPYRFIHGTTVWKLAGSDNKNVYLHARAEQFPYDHSRTALAAHLIRLISVALGLGTLLVGTRIFALLWPDRPDRRLLALGAMAFWPEFVYTASVITNDILLFFLTTLALWLVLRLVRDGPSGRRMAVLGIVLGAAMLTKLSALAVVGVAGLAILSDRRAWRYAPLAAGLIVLIAGGWYLHNQIAYGDFTAFDAMYQAWPGLSVSHRMSFGARLDRVPFIYQTFWALLGANTVGVPPALYVGYDVLTGIVLAGAALWGVRTALDYRRGTRTGLPPSIRYAVLCGALLLALVAATIRYTFQNFAGNQGRFLLPGIAAWAALIALGLDAWTPRRWRWGIAGVSLGVLAAFCTISVYDYRNAYRVIPAPDKIAYPLAYRYENDAEITGTGSPLIKARPGDTVTITVYWRALRPTETELLAYVHSVDSDLVRRDTYPATGNLISTDWKPGETWTERHIIRLPADAAPQQVYTLVAGLYDPQTGRTLDASDPGGAAALPVIGRIAIRGPRQNIPIAYRFGRVIGLERPSLAREGDQVKVCLRWQALADTPVDYQLFVHVLSGAGAPLGQSDVQAGSSAYPTSAWSPGEVIAQCVAVAAPDLPDAWHVVLGLYTLADLARLPVRDAGGHTLPDGMVTLTLN